MMHKYMCVLALLSLVHGAWSRIQYLGVAISGIDFGCDIDGGCPIKPESIPLSEFGGGDGAGQMQHFVKDDKMNIFRLPLTWQFILNGQLGGPLDDANFAAYDKLMSACLDTGAYCMIDLHNFARYDKKIIGQGGPTNDQFADVWSQIAKKYAGNDKIVFGLMNEPHELDIKLWADSCQAAVTAIRKAGAEKHMILLPGTNFTTTTTYLSTGSAQALDTIKNPDGSKDGLLLDLHMYLDINNSGTHEECTTDNVEAIKTVAAWLKQNKRQAMISETGASMSSSCMTDFCNQNRAVADNSDVFIGYVGWGAGSFSQDYMLSLTPLGTPGSYTDNKLVKECILGVFNNAKSSDSSSSSSASVTSTAKSTGAKTASSTSPTGTPSDSGSHKSKDNGVAGSKSLVSIAAVFVSVMVASTLPAFM